MYHELREVYWWDGQKRDIKEFVSKCPIQEVKAEHRKASGLIEEMGVPTWKWEEINIYFVVGLHWTQRKNDLISKIVDILTKFANFIPVKSTYSAEDYAKIYIQKILNLNGIPLSLLNSHLDFGDHSKMGWVLQ